MFRTLVWTLRQRRYAMLAAFLTLIALGCAAAGTFELHRFQEKQHDNHAIRANAHAAPVPLTRSLVLVATGRAQGADAIRYRTVAARGTYLPDEQQYVGEQSQGGRLGFYVLTPLRTSEGVLLVVRGFVAANGAGHPPVRVSPPPPGIVEVRGRLRDTQGAGDDQYGRLGSGEISAINPIEQAGRLRLPTYQAYLTLNPAQPGATGLQAIPAPGLSNPTGGAGELQLLSYVIQWFTFALLALAAPFVFSRAEVRDARRRFLGIDPDTEQFDRPRASERPPAIGAASGSDLVVRTSGELAGLDRGARQQLRRAARLADRYDRSLGPQAPTEAQIPADAHDAETSPQGGRRAGSAPGPGLSSASAVPRSADTPHRVTDEYHAQYSDYLWQLALADGAVFGAPGPDPAAADPAAIDSRGTRARTEDDERPRQIDG